MEQEIVEGTEAAKKEKVMHPSQHAQLSVWHCYAGPFREQVKAAMNEP